MSNGVLNIKSRPGKKGLNCYALSTYDGGIFQGNTLIGVVHTYYHDYIYFRK